MTTNQLKYFITIADHGSIQKAAFLLDVTPSSLSQFLRKLEWSLEQPLFFQTGQKLASIDADACWDSVLSVLQGTSACLD